LFGVLGETRAPRLAAIKDARANHIDLRTALDIPPEIGVRISRNPYFYSAVH